MIINLTTPMSDDKERERHTKAVLDAIEQYTEKRMNDDQPTHHNAVVAATGTDRIGGAGGLPCGVVGVATQSDAVQADIDAMESILWVDTIIDDQEAIAKAFARHRQYGYDQGYYEGCTHPLQAENERLREHLISALDTLKDAEVCDDNCGPCNEARAALGESK